MSSVSCFHLINSIYVDGVVGLLNHLKEQTLQHERLRKVITT